MSPRPHSILQWQLAVTAPTLGRGYSTHFASASTNGIVDMGAALRLFRADDWSPAEPPGTTTPDPATAAALLSPAERWGGLTVSEAFEQLVVPEHPRWARSTLNDYRCYVRRWEEWVASLGARRELTVYQFPAVAGIRRAHLLEWRQWLQKTLPPTTEGRTINAHLGAIALVLNCLVEHEVIGQAPKLRRVPQRRGAVKHHFGFLSRDQVAEVARLSERADVLTDEDAARLAQLRQMDELSRLYDACHAAHWPRREPVSQWRAAVVLWAHLGFRTGELIGFQRRHKAIRWRNIVWDEQSPAPNGKARNRWGWLCYTPVKQTWAKDEELVLPLNESMHWHLRSIEPHGGGKQAEPVFAWPRTHKLLYATWRAICDAAGLRPKADREGHQADYDPCHLRKTAQSWIEHYSDRTTADEITGHAPRGVTGASYAVGELKWVAVLTSLPQPEAFLRRGDESPRLF